MTPTLAEKRLAALLKRESEVRAALRDEREKRRIQAAKDNGRLASIIGHALLKAAKQPDFELMLKSVLRNTPLSESEQKFLEGRHWL